MKNATYTMAGTPLLTSLVPNMAALHATIAQSAGISSAVYNGNVGGDDAAAASAGCAQKNQRQALRAVRAERR